MALPGHRKHGEELRIVERDVKLLVHYGACSDGIGNIKQSSIGPARKSGPQHLAHGGASAITAGKICGLAAFALAVGALELRDNAVGVLFETHELDGPLDGDAKLCKTIDQESLVLILWKHQHVRIGADAGAKIPEGHFGDRPSSDPEIGGAEAQPTLDDFVSQAELAIELERARLHADSTRCGAWFRCLVDDAKAHAELCEPKGQYEPSGTSPGDQYIASLHNSILRAGAIRWPPSITGIAALTVRFLAQLANQTAFHLS